jgi:hypothetical protein
MGVYAGSSLLNVCRRYSFSSSVRPKLIVCFTLGGGYIWLKFVSTDFERYLKLITALQTSEISDSCTPTGLLFKGLRIYFTFRTLC